MTNIIKEDLEDFIFKQKLTYVQIAEIYGISKQRVRTVAVRLGITLPQKYRVESTQDTATKICNKCKVEKLKREFGNNKYFKHGVIGTCKKCAAYKTRENRYNLRENKLAEMLKVSSGLCQICNKLLENFYLDHCHTTGEARGILCRECNLGLGHFKDNIESLASAIAYLKNHESKQK